MKKSVLLLTLGLFVSSCAPTAQRGGSSQNMAEFAQNMAKAFDSKLKDNLEHCSVFNAAIRIASANKGDNFIGTMEFDSNLSQILTMEKINKNVLPLSPFEGVMLGSWRDQPMQDKKFKYAEWKFEETTKGYPVTVFGVLPTGENKNAVCLTILTTAR